MASHHSRSIARQRERSDLWFHTHWRTSVTSLCMSMEITGAAALPSPGPFSTHRSRQSSSSFGEKYFASIEAASSLSELLQFPNGSKKSSSSTSLSQLRMKFRMKRSSCLKSQPSLTSFLKPILPVPLRLLFLFSFMMSFPFAAAGSKHHAKAGKWTKTERKGAPLVKILPGGRILTRGGTGRM